MVRVFMPILIAIMLTGCTNGLPNGIHRPPEGKVILDDEHYTMIQSYYEWTEEDFDITTTANPNELEDNFETFVAEKGDTLTFKIDNNPISFTVTKLNEDGTIESVQIKDNKINGPLKEGYYIYELNTTWDQGKATFTFDINVH
ncbi:hypothetical protein [Psychrobacillus psychrodurans]|uniref:hypothetical protein n=1 Tax=Psychrobacillus psychrodurans TaxID=126157 RepID=UPI003D04BD8E